MNAQNGVRVILPNAPHRAITVNMGMRMRAWYDIKSLDRFDGAISQVDDEEGIEESVTSVRQLLDHECDLVGSENVVLGGFSQGAAMSLYTALQYPRPLAGIAICSGYVLMHEKLIASVHDANKNVPIFAYHGADDQMVPVSFASNGYEALSKAGITIPLVAEEELGHNVSELEVRSMEDFFLNVLKLPINSLPDDPKYMEGDDLGHH
jgi:phospholipase/carboxylesterase